VASLDSTFLQESSDISDLFNRLIGEDQGEAQFEWHI